MRFGCLEISWCIVIVISWRLKEVDNNLLIKYFRFLVLVLDFWFKLLLCGRMWVFCVFVLWVNNVIKIKIIFVIYCIRFWILLIVV